MSGSDRDGGPGKRNTVHRRPEERENLDLQVTDGRSFCVSEEQSSGQRLVRGTIEVADARLGRTSLS